MKRPHSIKNLSKVKRVRYESKAHGVAGTSRDIGAAVGARHLGADVTRIPPRRRSAIFHCHKHKEELFMVLKGRCRLRLGNKSYPLRAGDVISRPTWTGISHCFENPYKAACDVLMLGVMTSKGLEDVVYYPEIQKRLRIDSHGRRHQD